MNDKCTKVLDFIFDNVPLVCGKPGVLKVNEDVACGEHAPELAQLSDVIWPPPKQ